MPVLATSIPAARHKKKVIETAETAGKDGKESKDEYPENLL